MSLGDFLARLTEHLDHAGVAYMVSGSVASIVHGEPRSTQDVDLVVELDRASLDRLLHELPEDRFFVSPEAALAAVRRRSQFNVIDFETGWKADLIVRKDRPFSESEFARRKQADVLGVPVMIASAEDVVLSKLEWAKKSGGSERQLRDVMGILRAPGQSVDRAYVSRWAADLGVADLWRAVSEEP